MGKQIKTEPYLNIPHFILFNKELDAENKRIIADIYSLSQLPKGCYKSQNGFGSFLNITRSSISKRLENLENDGYIFAKKLRPELKNSRKRYTINIDKFNKTIEMADNFYSTVNNQLVHIGTTEANQVLQEKTIVIPTGTTTIIPENYQVVHTGTTTSAPSDIYYYNTNTTDNYNSLLQTNTEKLQKKSPRTPDMKNECVMMTSAQLARNTIIKIEDVIISSIKKGIEIIQNIQFINKNNLWDYVENKSEYEIVLPLVLELIRVNKALHG